MTVTECPVCGFPLISGACSRCKFGVTYTSSPRRKKPRTTKQKLPPAPKPNWVDERWG